MHVTRRIHSPGYVPLGMLLASGLVLLAIVVMPASLAAPSTTRPKSISIGLKQVGQGFRAPVFVTQAPERNGRIFVLEQPGTIHLLSGRKFLDISGRVGSAGSEQGLLGLAFPPNFTKKRYFFVDYTDRNGNTVVSSFTLSKGGKTANPNSERVILRQRQPAANHNGGMLAFGRDGDLYIGLGDGGGANDTYHNGQNPGTFLAKILRVKITRRDRYSVPRDNPFVNRSGFKPETWAWGLRNPWRFSFDRANGDLYIGDVGQDRWEEVDHQGAGTRGQNFGWSVMEGKHCLQGNNCSRAGLTLPVAEYSTHTFGCAIIGGYVYRGRTYPWLRGTYLFGDECSGRIWALTHGASGWVMVQGAKTNKNISSFGEDRSGTLYVTDVTGGGIYRVTAKR